MSFNTSWLVVRSNEMTIDAVRDSLTIIFYTLTVVLGIIGNSMVLWVGVFKIKPDPKNPKVTNVWLVNLAVADLIFCFTRISSLIKKLFFNHWPFGIFVCKFNGFFKYANMFCSVFLLAVISLDRTLCVWKPVLMQKKRTLSMARVMAVAVWMLAFLLSAPYFFYRQVYLKKNNITSCSLDGSEVREGHSSVKYALYSIRFMCGFLLPFVVIIICSILTAIGIKHTRLAGKSRKQKKIIPLVVAFFLCWAPYHCLLLVKMVDIQNVTVKMWHPVASGLAYFHSCVNPLLYFCMWVSEEGKLRVSLERALNNRRQRSMRHTTLQYIS